MTADALASPASLVLLAAVVASCVLTAAGGRRRVWSGLALFVVLAIVNWIIALNVSEFGEFGLALVLLAGLAMLIITPISGQIGSYLRERRASVATLRRLIGE